MKHTLKIRNMDVVAHGPSILEEYLLEQMQNVPPPPPGYHYELSVPVLADEGKAWHMSLELKPDLL